jgi:hypothetical protein
VVRGDFEHQATADLGEPAAGGRRRSPMTGALVIGATALLVALPACSSSPAPGSASAPPPTSTSTSSPPSISLPQVSATEIAACQADARTLESALAAYDAQKGAYPSPSLVWSAATYAANFAALMSTANGGPYLSSPPTTRFYVIEYDSLGHVWIAPPGAYSATYNRGQSFDANPSICLAAVG